MIKVKRDKLKIISGGQTGVDQLALKIAKELEIETGGHLPHGCITEEGPMPHLVKEYFMSVSVKSGYNPRTELNVKNADCTLIFGDVKSPGSLATIKYCQRHKKPYSLNPKPENFQVALDRGYRVFNIAGNRRSRMNLQQYFDIDWMIRQMLELTTE